MTTKKEGKAPPLYLEGETKKGKFTVALYRVVGVEKFTGQVDRQTKLKSGIIVNTEEVACVNILTDEGNVTPMERADYDHVCKLWRDAMLWVHGYNSDVAQASNE